MITERGTTIRSQVSDLRIIGRNTQGVRLIQLAEDDRLVSVARIEEETLPPGVEATVEGEETDEEEPEEEAPKGK
ncbi:MAG: DNA gyrase C-terminal beta-propeller domain-containing protein [bacterium]